MTVLKIQSKLIQEKEKALTGKHQTDEVESQTETVSVVEPMTAKTKLMEETTLTNIYNHQQVQTLVKTTVKLTSEANLSQVFLEISDLFKTNNIEFE